MLLADCVTLLPVHVMTESSKWLIYPLGDTKLALSSYGNFILSPWSWDLLPLAILSRQVDPEAHHRSIWWRGVLQSVTDSGLKITAKRNYSKERETEKETKRHTKLTPLFLLLILTDMKLLCQFSINISKCLLFIFFHFSPPALINSLEVGCIQGYTGKAWRQFFETPPPYSIFHEDTCSHSPCWPQAPEAINWCVISLDQGLLQGLHLYLLPVTEVLPGSEASKFFSLEICTSHQNDRHCPQWNLGGKHHRWDILHCWTR